MGGKKRVEGPADRLGRGEMRKVPAAERDEAVRETARLLQIENLLDRARPARWQLASP